MFNKAVFPGKYIQGAGAINELPKLVKLFGSRGLILASPTTYEKILPESGINLQSSSLFVEKFNRECCEEEISRICEIISSKKADVLIGMGGGKSIDSAKIAADRMNIPVIIVPTIASTDAPCSGCAVLYSEQGVFESVYYQKLNPSVVLVDTEIIVKSPVRFLVAGMGDALATWFEARSCSASQSQNECGGISTMSGISLSKLCYDTLMKYGLNAKIAAQKQIITPALEHVVEANILLSGIGFESGGLAAAHSIHNGFTALEETHKYYHGEKVAFGVLAGLQLTDAPAEGINDVFSFCEKINLPTTLSDIGVNNLDKDKIMIVAEKACAPGEYIHHESGIITPKKVFNAILAADAFGEYRK